MATTNALDVLEYFESAPMADVERAIKFASRIVTDRASGTRAAEPKPASSTNGQRTRGGQKKADSIRVRAEAVLRDQSKPMTVAEIAAAIDSRFHGVVNKASLVSVLSRLVGRQDTFCRPEDGHYGLLEWGSEAASSRDQHDDAALFGGDA